jgi:hypothetical protein
VSLPTAAYYASRRWPFITETYRGLFGSKPFSSAAAIAWVRGTLCGQVVVRIYAGLLWLAIKGGLTWPRLQGFWTVLHSSFLAATIVSNAINIVPVAAVLIVLVISVARRWISSGPVLAGLAGLASLATMFFGSFEGRPRDAVEAALVIIGPVGLAAVFMAFDLLTMLVASFIFQLWVHSYALTKMFEPVGNWQAWLPFWLWYAFVAWAAFVAYRALWNRFGKRVAEAFE